MRSIDSISHQTYGTPCHGLKHFLIMLRCKEVYQYARTHKYFGISSPKIMEEMEQEGFSDESDGPDPE